MKMLQTLYSKEMSGTIRQWSVEVRKNSDGSASIIRKYGQIGGKITEDEKLIKKGKNIGRSNETTPEEQAISEARSLWSKQLDKGYTVDTSGETDSILPMSCQPFKNNAHKMTWPAYGQMKLNGVRCFARKISEGVIDFRSKKGKSYNHTLGHLVPALNREMKTGEIIDGEVYNHNLTFNQITSAVKKLGALSPLLEFWAFDMINDLPQKQRFSRMVDISWGGGLIVIDYVILNSAAEVKKEHDKCVANGFEGLIIRAMDGLYLQGKRPAHIQKFKEFIDHEFTVIGGRPAEGQHEGCIIFRVKGKAIGIDGILGPEVEFDTVPKWNLERRREAMKEVESFIGLQATVRYHSLSDDGVPVPNPVLIEIRDYE